MYWNIRYILNAVTFRRESLFSFSRVAILIILSGSLATWGSYPPCTGSGLGLYDSLFHSTVTTQTTDLFIYSIGAIGLLFSWFFESTDLLLSIAPPAVVYINSSGEKTHSTAVLATHHKLYRPTTLSYPCWVRLSQVSFRTLSQNTRPNDNAFLVNLELKCKELYSNLPDNSVLKRSDSLVNKRINLSNLDVIQILYKLNSNEPIQNISTFPLRGKDGLDVPGIYCFVSKDKSNLSYYIGSSVNMKRRYNRHLFNLNHKDTRNSQANPKFYSYVRKYGIESLDFGSLLVTQDYLLKFSGFELQSEETSLLKLLTQLDLLLTEQYFLNIYDLSLNISPWVGTRESSVLSAETRQKMSDSHLGIISSISEDKWAAIKARIKESWENDSVDSERRKSFSILHGRPVVILDCNKKELEEFPSQLKAAEYLGVNRNIVNSRLASGKILDSKIGPVYIQDKEGISKKIKGIQILLCNVLASEI